MLYVLRARIMTPATDLETVPGLYDITEVYTSETAAIRGAADIVADNLHELRCEMYETYLAIATLLNNNTPEAYVAAFELFTAANREEEEGHGEFVEVVAIDGFTTTYDPPAPFALPLEPLTVVVEAPFEIPKPSPEAIEIARGFNLTGGTRSAGLTPDDDLDD